MAICWPLPCWSVLERATVSSRPRPGHIDVPTVRDLDLRLSRRHGTLLAEVLRCSPHLVRNMTQSRGGRVRSGLVAIRQPAQLCPACARRHAPNPVTHGTLLRNWMEGWRITCPICGAALEDYRLYQRLFRADPSDGVLLRIESGAREGEEIMDRASRRQGGGSGHAALMCGLLFPQACRHRIPDTALPAPRLLGIVVPGSDEFFRRLPPENWPCSSRMLPLNVRRPVLAGLAAVLSRPDYWLERLLDAAAPQRRVGLLRCVATLAASDQRAGVKPNARRCSHILPQY